MSARVPELEQRYGEQGRLVQVAALAEPVSERRAEVLVFGVEPLQPVHLLRPPQLGFGKLGELGEVAQVPAPQPVKATAALEFVEPELTDGLQHPEAHASGSRFTASQQALLEQRADDLQMSTTHGFGRFEREPAGEDRQLQEYRLLPLAKEVVAPLDGGTQGLLPLRDIAALAGKKLQPLLEAIDQPWNPSNLRRAAASSSASGSPSSRRQMSVTTSRFRSSSTNSGTLSRTRAANSSLAADSESGSSGYSDSPTTCSGSRLVARTRTPGAAASSSCGVQKLDARLEKSAICRQDANFGTPHVWLQRL
jgi:hypothetical protein